MTFFHPILTTYYDTSYDDDEDRHFPVLTFTASASKTASNHRAVRTQIAQWCVARRGPSCTSFRRYGPSRSSLRAMCCRGCALPVVTSTKKPSTPSHGLRLRPARVGGSSAEVRSRDRELAQGVPPGKNIQYVRKREEDVEKVFKEIMAQVPDLLEEVCRGKPTEDASALPGCSWEEAMKAYILSFP
jgi:hypothetical protein